MGAIEFPRFVFCTTHLDHVSESDRFNAVDKITAWAEENYSSSGRLILIALAAFAAVAAWAQTDSLRLAYSVSGKVSDARTGKELPAVNIRVSGRQYATVSNADGVFVIKSDAPIRELVISHLGYKTVRQAVENWFS